MSYSKKISEKYTHLDVLVNNASIMIGIFKDPLQIPDELELQEFRTNLDGYHFVTKRALPLLFKSPSGFDRTIVNVTSGAWYFDLNDTGFSITEPTGPYAMLGYCATKAAENGLIVALHKLYVEDSEQAKKI